MSDEKLKDYTTASKIKEMHKEIIWDVKEIGWLRRLGLVRAHAFGSFKIFNIEDVLYLHQIKLKIQEEN